MMLQDLSGKSGLPGIHKSHKNATGKKMCGLCARKAAGKNVWVCAPGESSLKRECPAPDGICVSFLKKPSVIHPPQPKKKGLPVPEGVKFLYIGAPRGKTKKGVPQHQGVVTVAWITPGPGVLHLGFFFCSPEDRWCKATGRDMALARLLHPLVIPFLYDAKRTVHEVVRSVLSHDFGRLAALSPGATMWERVPSWTRGLVRRVKLVKLFEASLPGFDIFDRPPKSDSTHAADAFAFLNSRREKKTLAERCSDMRRETINEAAAVSPEAWKELDKRVRRRFIGAPPLDFSLAIIARMMRDIAALGNG